MNVLSYDSLPVQLLQQKSNLSALSILYIGLITCIESVSTEVRIKYQPLFGCMCILREIL